MTADTPQRWRPIAEAPPHPMPVLLFSATIRYWNAKTADIVPAYEHGEANEIGYWDGQDWFYSMTNHLVFEFRPDEACPTHWMPLPAPPEGDGDG